MLWSRRVHGEVDAGRTEKSRWECRELMLIVYRNSTLGYNATIPSTYWSQYENIHEYNGTVLHVFERMWAVCLSAPYIPRHGHEIKKLITETGMVRIHAKRRPRHRNHVLRHARGRLLRPFPPLGNHRPHPLLQQIQDPSRQNPNHKGAMGLHETRPPFPLLRRAPTNLALPPYGCLLRHGHWCAISTGCENVDAYCYFLRF